jgi:hypothetical protein
MYLLKFNMQREHYYSFTYLFPYQRYISIISSLTIDKVKTRLQEDRFLLKGMALAIPLKNYISVQTSPLLSQSLKTQL